MSSWDVPATVPTEEDAIEALAKEMQGLIETKARVDAAVKKGSVRLAAYFPEDIGEHSRTVRGLTITVTRGEKTGWDTDLLEQMFPIGQRPPYLDMKLGVSKRQWEKLDDPTKATLLPAMTRSASTPKITIEG